MDSNPRSLREMGLPLLDFFLFTSETHPCRRRDFLDVVTGAAAAGECSTFFRFRGATAPKADVQSVASPPGVHP